MQETNVHSHIKLHIFTIYEISALNVLSLSIFKQNLLVMSDVKSTVLQILYVYSYWI
jgi:hypothetical protein